MKLSPAITLLLSTLPPPTSSYCWSCANAPSRSWSWWFGFGSCACDDYWSGQCCDGWSLGSWSDKWEEWVAGKSCEAQPENACKKVTGGAQVSATFEQEWKFEPVTKTQAACEAESCMWVECFPDDGNWLGTTALEMMCNECEGPWKGECDWHSYEPGALAFSGPGKYCGFRYPTCPASAGSNCFCGEEAISTLRAGWCNNGQGMGDFCPSAMDHGDGRTQVRRRNAGAKERRPARKKAGDRTSGERTSDRA